MYVYLDEKREGYPFSVGFYDPKGKWHQESNYKTAQEAAERVRYLNGGTLESEADEDD